MENLLQRFWAGDQRALARAISVIENSDEGREELLVAVSQRTGQGYILGLTGSPGAGKSSLADRLTGVWRAGGQRVGVVAVDPSSPFTGGAILGDRIRMQEHAVDQDVFIRSMGSRGSLGGLARSTKDVVRTMDAFGFGLVLVETVGVGQAELDIMNVADTVVVVLTPGAGDGIQTIKAGIMEIADVFAVNKCDLPGAERLAMEVNMMLDLNQRRADWRPPVVLVSAETGQGVAELAETIDRHRQYKSSSGLLDLTRRERLKAEVLEIVNYRWQCLVNRQLALPGGVKELLERVAARQVDPYTAAAAILARVAGHTDDGSPA
ncbi:MAG TPA: methylmalonyl Co-A mutase-associated GTPase MeaB [Spirochaetia bacterium]|nr:methylmalonyl Co-A mutase-associated GTPase MeaB [Spirochaetia bacterium]